jgi:hypothetical protein
MLSATQQMALNQIQGATMDQLMQIDTEALRDPMLAQEFGARAFDLAERMSPELRQANAYFQDYQALMAAGREDAAFSALEKAQTATAETYGYEYNSKLSGAEAAIQWNSAIQANMNRIQQPEMTTGQRAMQWGTAALGLGLIVAGILGTVKTFGAASPIGAISIKKGLGLIVASATSLGMIGGGGVFTYQAFQQNDRNLSVEQKQEKMNEYIQTQIGMWKNEGWSAERINNELENELAPGLLPIYQQLIPNLLLPTS